MPRVKFACVDSFSTENEDHPVTNLLADEVTGKKWLCNKGDPICSVVLQLCRSVKITSVSIGLYNSAFVEVSVGRSEKRNYYEQLVPVTAVASEAESRRGQGIDKVKSFSGDELAAGARDRRWDRIRIQCKQPFNRSLAYGLTFVHVFEGDRPMSQPAPADPTPESSDDDYPSEVLDPAVVVLPATPPPASPIIPPISENSWLTLNSGSSDDDYRPGKLFATYMQTQADTTDAQIRHASSQALRNIAGTSTQLVKTGIANNNTCANDTASTSQADDDMNIRDRNNLLYQADDEEPNAKIDRIVELYKKEKSKRDREKSRNDEKNREREKSRHGRDGDRSDNDSGIEDGHKKRSKARKRDRHGSNERSKDRDSGSSKREKRSDQRSKNGDSGSSKGEKRSDNRNKNGDSGSSKSEKRTDERTNDGDSGSSKREKRSDQRSDDGDSGSSKREKRSEHHRSEKDGKSDPDKSDKEKDRSEKEKDRSEKEKDRSEKEKDRSEKEKDRSEKEKDRSEKEKDRPEKEKDRSEKEKDRSEKEKGRSEKEKDRSEKEKDRSEKEKDRSEKEKDRSDKEKDRSEKKKDRSEKEKDRSEKEKDRSEKEKDRSDKEKDRSEKKKDRSEKEKDRSEKEKDRSEKEKDRSEKEKDRSEKEKDRSDKEKDRSEKEKDRSEKEKGSSKKESTEKDRSYKDRSERDRSEKDERRRSVEKKSDNVECDPDLKAGPVSSTPHTLMSKVVFTMSGYENPRRAIIRTKAFAMGAKYEREWNSNCTHLICAFPNTPKLRAVRALPNGSSYPIVRARWVEECCELRRLLPWQWYATENSMLRAMPIDWQKRADEQAALRCDSDEDTDTDDELERIIRKQLKEKAEEARQNEPNVAPQSSSPRDTPPYQDGDKVPALNEPLVEDIQANFIIPFDEIETEIDIPTPPDSAEASEDGLLAHFLDGYVFLIDRSVAETQFDPHLLERLITAYGGDVVKPCHYARTTVVNYIICSGNEAPVSRAKGAVLVTPDWVWRCHMKQRMCTTKKFLVN